MRLGIACERVRPPRYVDLSAIDNGSLRPEAFVNDTAARPAPHVSIVIPVFDEEAVLPLLLPRLRAVMDALPNGADVWFVDDGSRDATAKWIEQAHADDPRIKLVQLSRNFGHAAAITAGLDCAAGDAVVLMDADLQDPPEIIPDMVGLYLRGFDVVHARRLGRESESPFKRGTAWLFYRIMGLLTKTEIQANVGEFRLMSRAVVVALGQFHERHRLVRGLVSWVGFSQTTIGFVRPGRAAGKTKYPFLKMLRLSVDALTSFSAAPLRMATLMGAAGLLAGFAYAVYAIYVRYRLGQAVPGWTSLVILNIFFSSLVLMCLGLVGEYVGRIFEEVKRRPIYLIRRKIDADMEAPVQRSAGPERR
jgi:dolichol-phosphate mannosyltransferase